MLLLLLLQEIRSVELGVCPMQLFHFWSRDVTFIQFKICCCVQNFIEIGWFFTEIWRYIDFQNDGRPPSWNCFTTIQDHPRSLCAGRSCLSNFISIWYTHLKITLFEFFAYLAWNAYSDPQNGVFGGLWTHKCDYSASRPPKGTSLSKSASFKLSTVKIRWWAWPVG